MEKLGIEPATPGLQGIALIHYTTGALYNNLDWADYLGLKVADLIIGL